MADTKISGLPIASIAAQDVIPFAKVSSSVTSGITFGEVQADVLASPVITGHASIEGVGIVGVTGNGGILVTSSLATLCGPVIAAHNTNADTAMRIVPGSVATAPVAGNVEYDGRVPYFTHWSSTRGVVSTEQFVCLTSVKGFANNTNSQAIFTNVGTGALTVAPSTTYTFEGLFVATGMSGTSGNAQFDLLGAGTATLASLRYYTVGLDNTTLTTAAAQGGSFHQTASTIGNVVTAATGTGLGFQVSGIMRVNGGGTVIPSFKMTSSIATAQMQPNSYMLFKPLGTDSVVSVGRWS